MTEAIESAQGSTPIAKKPTDKERGAQLSFLNQALSQAIDQFNEEAITTLAKELLGEDFWVGIREAKRLRHGEVHGLPSLNECLSKLVGAYTPALTASSMLHAKREEEGAIAFLRAKDYGYTDGTAEQYSRLHVSKLRMQEKAFEGLAEGIKESIQVVKRLQDAEIAEMHMLPRQEF